MRPKGRTPSEMKHSVGPTVVLALAVLVGCLFVGTNLYYNRGDVSGNGLNISAPLDDTFIHLQYGRQMSQDNRDNLRMASRRLPEYGVILPPHRPGVCICSPRARGHACAFTFRNGKGK
jgi:hypothetical protein